MIKRSESKSKSSRRDRSERINKKRRLMMEGLEQRQLLAVFTDLPTQPPTQLEEFTEPRNVGTVQAFVINERTETTIETGNNNLYFDAEILPLGTGPGQQDTIDVNGALPIVTDPINVSGLSADIDTYGFDLRGGDILDIATIGAAGGITVQNSQGSILLGSDTLLGGLQFPLQTLGNANATMVVPEDGRYFVTVAPAPAVNAGNYTLGLRVYRPVSEQLAIGDAPILYLDFHGGLIDNNIFNDAQTQQFFPPGGVTRVRTLAESLPILGLELGDTVTANRIIDGVVDNVVRIYEDLARTGTNGDYETTANPGDYGLRILNSKDHRNQINLDDPRVTRLLIGGTGVDFGVGGIFGQAQGVDVGNFDLSQFGIFALDAFAATAQGAQLSPRVSQVDFVINFLGSVAAHEAGHTFGMIHTDNTNSIDTLSDSGGGLADIYGQGLGPDGIFGTMDDVRPIFMDDFYNPAEQPDFGFNRVTAALSHVLSTGTVGSTVSGRVFQDVNRDGIGTTDAGLGGVTVFADVNGNGVLDGGEPSQVTDVQGRFELPVASSRVNIVAIEPDDFASTTPTTVSALPGSTQVSFGFGRVISNITGTVFADNDGDGIRDATDSGLEGVYVYLDLDGDNRPDLGEPGTNSSSDGTYVLNFPGPGTYTIRNVIPAGFEQSFPVGDEHMVIFDGVSLTDNFDFGLLPSQDFGDAPDSYGTTLSANGARHGITAGLSIGAAIDREIDGQPNSTATGDDIDAEGDDEDGVRLTSPLGPGAPATFEITATNTTGAPAFVQAFIDLDGDNTFSGLGEKFVSDLLVPSGTLGGTFPLVVNVPSNTLPGTTYTRFRLSQTSGLGPTGFADTGEVEDYSFPILTAPEVANNDQFTVSRNTQANQLDVLANDFQTPDNQLVIDSVNTVDTEGTVVPAGDQKSVFYTPPNGFIGRDVFSYTVVDQFGNRSSASVVVNVNFQSAVPIALDDTFEVAEGSVNRALNVLDNDVPSISGGLSVTSVTAGSAGGTVTIVGGGQSIRYTPFPGFNGTEQFSYSVQDAIGSVSTAQVTINLLPGSRNDDVVDFTVGIFDSVNVNTPVSNVQVGDEVLVRVFVEDIRAFANPEGVASAFLDLLYTDELVATLDTDNDPTFPFDITFGPLFSGINGLQAGSATVPGLIDEVGGVQSLTNQQPHTGPVELFTLSMQAVSPGVAVFQVDPADGVVSETTVLASDVALTPSQLRLGNAELLIQPASDNFTSAIDDSFPDGRDSNGNLITNTSLSRNRLNVLANDNLGPTGTIREFGLVTAPSLGNVLIDDNGTPSNLNDDFFSYRANANANGLERFSYVIVTDDNIRSTAEVTIALGNQNANADVAYDFNLVNSSGASINSVSVGDRFGVQIIADDLRGNPSFVFAGFLDVMYDSGIIRPSNTDQNDNFDFDVVFGPGYLSDPDVVTTAAKPGVIDEFGTLFATIPSNSIGLDPALLATIFFDAVNVGTATVVGGPADSSPFSDTLLFQEDDPVEVSRIRYDKLQINVGGGTPLQNSFLRQDVNNDGLVSPIDALLVINEMSRVTPEGELPARQFAEGELASTYFTDVNGDNQVSAVDALHVINYLTRANNSMSLSEGEGVVVQSTGTQSVDESSSTDQAFAELHQASSPIVASSPSTETRRTDVQLASNSDAATDDDDDDVLDLLADDLSGLLS